MQARLQGAVEVPLFVEDDGMDPGTLLKKVSEGAGLASRCAAGLQTLPSFPW